MSFIQLTPTLLTHTHTHHQFKPALSDLLLCGTTDATSTHRCYLHVILCLCHSLSYPHLNTVLELLS